MEESIRSSVNSAVIEFPIIRYRAKGMDGSTESTFRDLVTSKLASAVWEYITMYKSTIPNFPKTETCELLILNRSVDLVAPIIHEWTYYAMCHDLLELDGNKHVQEDMTPQGLMKHYVYCTSNCQKISVQKSSGLSTRDIQILVQALPTYNEQMERLSLHVEIAGKINTAINEEALRDLGRLEQDLVFGGSKEVLNFLREYQDGSVEKKLRLMMIYAQVDPEKFEDDKGTKLMQLAKLSPEDMKVIENMKLLEGPTKKQKKEGVGFSLKFDRKKNTNALRKDRPGEEETWALFRFYPMLEELLEEIIKHDMPKDEYQCMNEPSPSTRGASGGPQSRRSRRTPAHAKSRASDDGIQAAGLSQAYC